MNKKIIFILCFIGIVFANGFFLYIINNNKSTIFSSTINKIEIDKTKSYTNISVEDLVSQFQNKQFGNEKYNDNVIVVKGTVLDIIYHDEIIEINLYCDRYPLDYVKCYMDIEFKDSLTGYEYGDEIKITGKVKGKFFDIVLEYCYI